MDTKTELLYHLTQLQVLSIVILQELSELKNVDTTLLTDIKRINMSASKIEKEVKRYEG